MPPCSADRHWLRELGILDVDGTVGGGGGWMETDTAGVK